MVSLLLYMVTLLDDLGRSPMAWDTSKRVQKVTQWPLWAAARFIPCSLQLVLTKLGGRVGLGTWKLRPYDTGERHSYKILHVQIHTPVVANIQVSSSYLLFFWKNNIGNQVQSEDFRSVIISPLDQAGQRSLNYHYHNYQSSGAHVPQPLCHPWSARPWCSSLGQIQHAFIMMIMCILLFGFYWWLLLWLFRPLLSLLSFVLLLSSSV